MPTQKPRTAVTLTPEAKSALDALAQASGKPVATVISELLSEMAPQLADLAKLVEHAKAGRKQAAKRTLAHMMGNQLAEILADQLPLKGVK